MSLISLSRVSYSLGARSLFADFTLALEPGERVGLVGLNGAGKSTLLKIIDGTTEPDSGHVARRHGAVIEYVAQTLPDSLRPTTLFDALAHRLPQPLRCAGFEYLVEQQLLAAGFPPEKHNQALGTLSGGEVNRALIARALVVEPDLVLLDEPTNHMDIKQVAEFERFLNEQLLAAAVIVSHDRALLDAATSKTLFLRDQQIYSFDLPFSKARDALAAHDAAAYKRRQDEEKELQRLRRSADRLAEWGKNFSNEKFSYRAKSMYKRIEKLEQCVTPIPQAHRAKVSLDTATTSSPFMLEVLNLALVTPTRRPLTTIEQLVVRRGERVAIVGRNGTGKSTLLKAVVGQWSTGKCSPQIRFNPSTSLGYYDQELAHFNDTERLAQAVLKRCPSHQQRVTAELVTCGFPYERHQDKIATLSGGERARLTFLILRLTLPHLLVLDEPTNHLDFIGIEQLEDSLIGRDSTVIFVSHDRCFIERVATRVVELPTKR
jgi:ATP-binding cassette subfamily F protein 3